MIEDSIIYASDYELYQVNEKNDKEDKTLGHWRVPTNKWDQIKYAYVYLTCSDGMIVKKFYIEKFGKYSAGNQNYDGEKAAFIFNKSEDVFFQWPKGVVQHHQYVNSQEIDKIPKLSEEQVKIRFEKSRTTMKKPYYSEGGNEEQIRGPRKKRGAKRKIILSSRDKLSKVWIEKFDKRKVPLETVNRLINEVSEGKEPEDVLFNYFNSLDN